MRRPVNLVLAVILLIACSSCFWYRDRGGYDHRGGGHGGQRHDDGGGHDKHR